MKRFLLALAGALLISAPSEATTFTVKNTSGTGGATFYSVNDSVRAGDLVYINAGDYTTAGASSRHTGPNPTYSGSGWAPGTRITYIGAPLAAHTVRVEANDLTGSYITVRGVQYDTTAARPNAGFGIVGTTYLTPAVGDSIVQCNIVEGTSVVRATDCIFVLCNFGGYNRAAKKSTAWFWSKYEGVTTGPPVARDTVKDCKMIFRSDANSPGQGHDDMIVMDGWDQANPMGSWIFLNTRMDFIRVTTGSDCTTFIPMFCLYLRDINGAKFLNCALTAWDSTGCTGDRAEVRGLYLRDLATNTRFDTDTLTLTAGIKKGYHYMSVSGNNYGGVWNNYLTNCRFIQLGTTGSVEALLYWQYGFRGDQIRYNTFISSDNKPIISANSVAEGGAVFDHNNFYAPNSDFGAVNFDMPSAWQSNIVFANNSLYSKKNSTGGMALKIIRPSGSQVLMLNNAYHNYGGTGGDKSIAHKYTTGTALDYYTPQGYALAFPQGPVSDVSVYGSPLFTDSSASAAFNGVPAAGSILLGAGVEGYNIGVDQTQADATRPEEISTMFEVSSELNTTLLQWVAVGDDSLTGTATLYDLRYRTDGAVTEGNWASSTLVIGEPTPAIVNTTQSMLVTGLAEGTDYWFAIKVSDGTNTSALSNVVHIRTKQQASGGGSGVIDP